CLDGHFFTRVCRQPGCVLGHFVAQAYALEHLGATRVHYRRLDFLIKVLRDLTLQRFDSRALPQNVSRYELRLQLRFLIEAWVSGALDDLARREFKRGLDDEVLFLHSSDSAACKDPKPDFDGELGSEEG